MSGKKSNDATPPIPQQSLEGEFLPFTPPAAVQSHKAEDIYRFEELLDVIKHLEDVVKTVPVRLEIGKDSEQ